jgi:hypothetical protein
MTSFWAETGCSHRQIVRLSAAPHQIGVSDRDQTAGSVERKSMASDCCGGGACFSRHFGPGPRM